MKPAKFAITAATIVISLVPPPLARLAVAGITATAAALLFWAAQEPAAIIGSVTQLQSSAQTGQTLLAITPWWPGAASEVALATTGTGAAIGDLAIALGEVQSVADGSRVGLVSILNADTLATLPLGNWRGEAAPEFTRAIAEARPAMVIVAAVLLVGLAQLTLRLGAAALFACVSAVTAFLLLNVNAHTPQIPVPQALHALLIVSTATAGGVLAFKATIGDIWRVGERVAAPLLALALVSALQETLPAALIWGLPIMAFLFPAVAPVALATALLAVHFEWSAATVPFAFALLLIARHAAPWVRAAVPTLKRPFGFSPKTRHTGEFPLETLLPEERTT